MPIITPHIPTPREQYEDQLWVREECYRFYTNQRRKNCNFLELLDLWLRAPYCESCIQSEPGVWHDLPEISAADWQQDISWHLGEDLLKYIEVERASDPQYALLCKKCGCVLRPWSGDDIFVVDYHLEEHYGIPIETTGKRSVSDALQKRILALYDRKCFKCGRRDSLHIDHIMPRSHGGDAAFRNLQPLCKECGCQKADQFPEELSVYLTMYFKEPPSDSYEGLFW